MTQILTGNWNNASTLDAFQFVCGHCGKDVAPNQGYFFTKTGGNLAGIIYVCHHCKMPTFIRSDGIQVPGAIFGDDIQDIEDKGVKSLYDEARHCMSVNAFTSSVLACRKLLMSIAVSKGADEGKSFISYVEFLSQKGLIPPDAKEWVDHIRTKGNEANHEIKIMERSVAEELVLFIEMLLKVIFEFPARIKKRIAASSNAAEPPPVE